MRTFRLKPIVVRKYGTVPAENHAKNGVLAGGYRTDTGIGDDLSDNGYTAGKRSITSVTVACATRLLSPHSQPSAGGQGATGSSYSATMPRFAFQFLENRYRFAWKST